MKRLLFTAVAAAAVTLGAAPAQAAVSCGAPGIDTILRTAHTRIFEVNGGDVFACQGVGGRAVLLPVFQFGPPGSVAVRGHFVAYFSGIAQSPEGKAEPLGTVAVVNLRTRRRTVFAPAHADDGSGAYVASIVVSAAGRTVWVGCLHTCAVYSARQDADYRTLDPGPVADSSLRRHGRRVTWLHDHTRRTARL